MATVRESTYVGRKVMASGSTGVYICRKESYVGLSGNSKGVYICRKESYVVKWQQ